MKRIVLFSLLLGSFALALPAQQVPVTEPNYELAERFSTKKVNQMVFSTTITPRWFKHSNQFWYWWKTPYGENAYLVDPVAKTKTPVFDMDELAMQLTEIIRDPFDAQHIPMRNLQLKDDKTFTFEVPSTVMVDEKPAKKKGADLKQDSTAAAQPKKPAKKVKKTFRFEYDIATRKLTDVSDVDKKKRFPRWASISPDSSRVVYVKGLDVYYTDMENLRKWMEDEKDSTFVEHRLTFDGTPEFAYGGSDYRGFGERDTNKRYPANAYWSPDSRYFATCRYDMSKIKDFWVIDVLSQPRPKLETYKYQMPGEPSPETHLYLFDMTTDSSRVIRTAAFKDQSLGIMGKPYTKELMYADYYPVVWLGDQDKFYIERVSRDLKRVDICAVHVTEDSARVIIEERLNTYVETRPLQVVNQGKELIQWSERNGWAHLYLYEADGTLKNAITKGAYHVENVVAVNEKERVVYFTACGVNPDENPYYMHLYRVNFDGSDMRLLNPGDYDSRIGISQKGEYFVSSYSRVDTAPANALYDGKGKKIMDLETADLSLLFAAGYQFPEPFKVKAADGVTDLYGVIYKPFDFDPNKLYPVIEYVYPGPQVEATNYFWSKGMNRVDRLAQVGFIVVTVGNRGGHPNRSKWYHNYGYGNLRDYGLEDQKYALQQLASQRPYMDASRVGIHGHSGGGFMSTAAILTYPDFYKAAVSCAGNHDNSIYNRWWSEQHHGILEKITEKGDTTFVYDIDKNAQIAGNLKGRLLLVHGDIDDNVHPANTMRVVNALIRANKRFDMLILPGQRHSFGDMDEYFFWRMADHFSEWLLGTYDDSVDIVQMNND